MAKSSLWDLTLSWMEENHGKNLEDDKKGTLNILLHHLDVLVDEVASVLEENFVPLDLETIETAGLEPLLVPNKLFPLYGCSYILQSEAKDGLKTILMPTLIKEEPELSSEEEEDGGEGGNVEEEYEFLKDESGDDPDPIDDEDYDEIFEQEMEEEGAFTCHKCSSTHETYDDLMTHLQDTKCSFRAAKASRCRSNSRRSEPREKKKQNRRKRKKSSSSKAPIEDRTCKVCSRTFSSLKYLKYEHSRRCEDCPNDPLKDYHLKCANCSKIYKTLPHYYLHMKTCAEKESDFTKVKTRSLKDMSCSKCGFIATSKEEYISANHACIPNKRYRCLKCDFKTCHPGSLRNHDLAIHHKDKPVHCCEICGASFSYKTGFNRHLKTHLAKPSKVPCPQCEMHFSCRSSLTRHMTRQHKPTQEHPCEICGKTYLTPRYLVRHIRSQHPESGQLEKHECIHCHSFFREKAYLKKHIRKKHGQPLK
eukprot:TRINITY_DN3952_c0_g1_i2.p1 TRINITY_DN3952_c0_g1~~TRINITY_DN3952_c0_g1_i2.p1  ORF type:complete len:478 (-),score=128.00 TRINITY_DN3952_c0_g1_i2:83-1516(-)